MKTTILILMLSMLAVSCTNSDAQDAKKITMTTTSGANFQCRSMGAVEACGVRLYDCNDGLRRFDVICANNVTVERW